MAKPSRHEVGTGLEHKVRAAGRPWTVGDIAMVMDLSADGRRVELTVEELARAVGSRIWMRAVGENAPADRDEGLA
ncbi:hypothetical protein [Streptomyces anulatus]|uniref:hypothetical protein n=1 Tax=Streptomyces anulatus TaxID=1892 RepID=UPI00053A07AD|nr:hypothetical protein [Streptomyces anulatus]